MYQSQIKGVILYRLNQNSNLNRVYRVCYIFGIQRLYLCDCAADKIGNVFSAAGKVEIIRIKSIDDISGNIVAFEKNGDININEIKDLDCDYLLFGGENETITRKICEKRIRIDTPNRLCLTADEALSIGLYYATRQDYSD